MIETNFLSFVERKLDIATHRQEVLAANVANVDTPGYRSRELKFSEQAPGLTMRRTEGAHLDSADAETEVRVIEAGGETKPNGNSVDLDSELTKVTKNGLEFVILVQVLQNKFRTIRSSLNEGAAS